MAKQLAPKTASKSGKPDKQKTLSGASKLQKKPSSRSGSSGWQSFNDVRDLARSRAKVAQLLGKSQLADASPKEIPNSQQPSTPTEQPKTQFDDASPFVAHTLLDSPSLDTLGF
jgi:hypothetical protein